MKKLLQISMMTTLALGITVSLYAQAVKIIHLQDGSQLKGRVVALQNGVYTVQTLNLGQVQVNESEIVSITQENMPAPSTGAVGSGNPSPQNIKREVQAVQSQVFADPKITAEIETLIQDPEIMEILSDPQLAEDIFTYDANRIQSNPNIQKLMSNPKMRTLMEKIQRQQAQ